MALVDHDRIDTAKALAIRAVQQLQSTNRRTLDALAARIFHYYSWAHECRGELAAVRGTLMAQHRSATLRHDELCQEALLNLLLRNFLAFNQYAQAEQLRSKAQLPENPRSSQQHSRYLYYLGRIRAIQLGYSEARDCLAQALRKAPGIALGFRITVSKWLVLVRLLLGEVPDRSEFTQADTRNVRRGPCPAPDGRPLPPPPPRLLVPAVA